MTLTEAAPLKLTRRSARGVRLYPSRLSTGERGSTKGLMDSLRTPTEVLGVFCFRGPEACVLCVAPMSAPPLVHVLQDASVRAAVPTAGWQGSRLSLPEHCPLC
eukprot:CAMPEP_0173419302 /NCGR_PEP_ID=MMETSP1357-20121228/1202_1 /TAXON_ID=77926 /ORGANISM="Hemiselmis rufescens, Strain PCC563" /LENGTH=103 /DNA_ID=CAMNT_0014381927 /DNA_START=185 /DNA_END=493 /DNA_ORIENTATION=-